MKTFLAFLLSVCLLSVCESTKKNNSNNTTGYDINKLGGTWQMEYISAPKITFEELYPANKPFIKFDVANKRISGRTSCNHFSGALVTKDSTIDFSGPILMTEMYCPGSGEGESVFITALTKVNSWKVDDSTLFFMSGDTMTMRFVKRPKYSP